MLNATTVTELSAFLDDHIAASAQDGIPTGIISTGPDTASQLSIIKQLSSITCSQGRRDFVSLTASQGTNLKALLKTIIQKATARNEDVDDDNDDETVTKKGSRLLNYDLQILSDHVRDRDVKQVVLAIQDTEAFDSQLLSELIEVLGYWHDRIPFVFLLNIATSLEFLQQRLSREAVKCLQGQLFDVAPSTDEVEQAFEAFTHSQSPLWMGPNLMRFALERQSDYIQSINSFVEAVRYAYMSCYYANAVSIFLDPSIKFNDLPADHFEALRNLESFRIFCQSLLENNELARLRDLLDKDEILFGFVKQRMQQGRDSLAELKRAINVLHELLLGLSSQQTVSKPNLYIQALSNKLSDSSSLRSLLLSIRKAPSSTSIEFLDTVMALDIPEDVQVQCGELREELAELITHQTDAAQPLRSEDDVKNSTLRTTVIAQKVELSKQKSSLSKQDAAYTAVLRRFTDLLEEYFTDKLIDPTNLVFHEIFLYDLKSPHREVFTPRPRHAVERALAAPQDYLACDCCTPNQGESDESTLAACQPATAVLYQLYLESGSLINVSDLWQAFQAVMGEERSEETNMALFQRALAELRYLGLLKSTRKRVDHVAKVAWRGL